MLQVRDVSVSFGEAPVLRGINLRVEQGEIVCLLGPSGCGKTTLLRVIAGLEKPEQGDVWFDGQSVLNIPIHQRGFGLMFQDFALFPHMNVAQNVIFGLKMQRLPSSEQRRRSADALELVGLQGFEQRDVAMLSGGERQRVALARSLAPNPRLLMLDEPMGSLDAALRERLVVELRDIIKRVGLTAIYVTHDQREAFAIADRMAVMNAGVIEQIGIPQQVYQQPATTFVAHFLGLNNVVPVLHHEDGTAHTALGDFRLSGQADAVLLHPDGLEVMPNNTFGAIQGHVEECIYLGDSYRIRLQTDAGVPLTLKIAAYESLSVQIGQQVYIRPRQVIPLRISIEG